MIQQILTILDEGNHMADGLGMMGMFDGGWWMWIMIIGGMVLVLLLAIWTYQDVQRFGENAALWALVVFFTMGFGVILYVLVRNPNRSNMSMNPSPPRPRPSQNNSSLTANYSPSMQYNPKTEMESKVGFCENCGTQLVVTDNFCPKCGTSVRST